MKRRALLIGINDYYLLGKLKFARQDAEATADALRRCCGFSEQDVTLMSCGASDARLGLSRFIELALENLAHCRDLDLLVFGFWGHSFSPEPGRRYLCGLDTIETDLHRTAVSLDVVKARLEQVQAENTLLVLDCCQNRAAGRAGAPAMTEGEEIALASLARDIQTAHRKEHPYSIPTVAVLNACREGEKAYEWEARAHGVFTAHLLDGFQQGFGGIASLAAWTADRVPRTTMDMLGQMQTPYITIEGKGDIPLPTIRPVTAGAAPVAEQATAPPSGRVEILKEPVLRVETTPAGATVSIDGRARGRSPVELPLPAGKYRLRAEFEGYEPVERAIHFDAAGDAELCVTLKERRVPTALFSMTAEQASEVQAATAEALGLPVEITNTIGMKLRLIPAGEFLMGSPDSDSDAYDSEKPQHRVRIMKPFYFGVYPVTQVEYEQVMGTNPSRFQGSSGLWGLFATPHEPMRPVEKVSWDDANAFCRKLTDSLEGGMGGMVCRLPTEAEWEYACRAGTTTRYCFGDDAAQLGQYAWFGENSGGTTHPVGQKQANAWGLYDMHGNVWEWCADRFASDYYANSPVDDPKGPASASSRVVRGGFWGNVARYCRSAGRSRVVPAVRGDYLGFRVALVPADESSK